MSVVDAYIGDLDHFLRTLDPQERVNTLARRLYISSVCLQRCKAAQKEMIYGFFFLDAKLAWDCVVDYERSTGGNLHNTQFIGHILDKIIKPSTDGKDANQVPRWERASAIFTKSYGDVSFPVPLPVKDLGPASTLWWTQAQNWPALQGLIDERDREEMYEDDDEEDRHDSEEESENFDLSAASATDDSDDAGDESDIPHSRPAKYARASEEDGEQRADVMDLDADHREKHTTPRAIASASITSVVEGDGDSRLHTKPGRTEEDGATAGLTKLLSAATITQSADFVGGTLGNQSLVQQMIGATLQAMSSSADKISEAVEGGVGSEIKDLDVAVNELRSEWAAFKRTYAVDQGRITECMSLLMDILRILNDTTAKKPEDASSAE